MLAYPILRSRTLATIARVAPHRLSPHDRQLMRLSEEQYAAAILSERRRWELDFALRGDPSRWSEWWALSRTHQTVALHEWSHWLASPDTYTLQLALPHGPTYNVVERP